MLTAFIVVPFVRQRPLKKSMAKLCASNGTLVLVSGDGTSKVPTAQEAYRMLSGNAHDLGVSVDAELRSLIVSEERAEVRLLISLSGDSHQFIHATPCVQLGSDRYDISLPVNSGSSHVVVDNHWLPLDPAALAEIAGIASDHALSWPSFLSLRQYLALSSDQSRSWVLLDHTAKGLNAAHLAPEKIRQFPDVGVKLYPYQQTGVRWLQRIVEEGVGGILADDMGLGKTLQIITLLLSVRGSSMFPALVVGPSSILENWRRELLRFAPTFDVAVHRGGERTGMPSELFAHDVVLTSYETVIRDEVLLRQRTWGLVIADEAQALKNPSAERTLALKRIPKRVALAVTGTPLENRLQDLWSIADFSTPGLLGDKRQFHEEYEQREDGAARIGELMAPLMLRRMTADVATDLPELIDIPHFVTLSPEEVRLYERLREAAAAAGKPNLALLSQLQQFCSHPMLTTDEGWPPDSGSKFLRLTEILGEALSSKEKVLVFASYSRIIDLISAGVRERFGVPSMELTGRTPIESRQELIDKFAEVEGGAVLVLNPRAGGVGLNITAASHVVHYSAEWNPAVIDQASKRAHRRGQRKVVRVHRLLCAGTIDEVVNDRVLRKRELATEAVIGTTGENQDLSDLIRAMSITPTTRDL